MRIFKNRKLITILITLLVTKNIFSQEILTNLNTSWTNVISGNVIAPPVITSYGFCLATDARTVCAFSDSGNLLWEKHLLKSKDISLFCLQEDFILLLDKSNNSLRLLNPSGCEIWNNHLKFTVSDKIIDGRDGRFFVPGERIIECYGINGICKWSIETPLQKKGVLQELPDGTLVVFLEEQNGKTKGLRISPFGKILEEILFAGEIINTCSCNNGVLLIFSDGTCGLFSTEGEESKNKWVFSEKNKDSFFVSDSNGEFLLITNKNNYTWVNLIDKNTGVLLSNFNLSKINFKDLKNLYYQENNIFLMDSKNAVLCTNKGKELWNGKLSEISGKIDYRFYTQSDYLVICKNDWSIYAYRTIQNQNKSKKMPENYNNYFDNLSIPYDILYSQAFDRKITSDNRINALKNGLYNNSELMYEQEILSICQSYVRELSRSDFGTRKEKSIFELDTTGFESILLQLTLFCNDNTQNCVAQILSKTDNKAYAKVLLSGISKNGYDPDGNILAALEKIALNTDYKDKATIKLICDAVYSVCEFMGRPAFNSKGKGILKNFLYPNYDAKTRDYARTTLKKILALDL